MEQVDDAFHFMIHGIHGFASPLPSRLLHVNSHSIRRQRPIRRIHWSVEVSRETPFPNIFRKSNMTHEYVEVDVGVEAEKRQELELRLCASGETPTYAFEGTTTDGNGGSPTEEIDVHCYSASLGDTLG